MARVLPTSVGSLGFVGLSARLPALASARAGPGLEGLRALGARLQRGSSSLLYLVLRTQGIHPFNPQDLSSLPWDVSFNTAASFVSNTNWQFYAGETTLSYSSQMFGLAVQNFVSAAVGIAVRSRSSAGAPRGRPRSSGTSTPTSRARCSTSCSRCRCSRGLFLPSQGAAPEPRRAHDLHHPHRPRADARPRPCRLPGGDQAARHQRRRLLQRQLGDAVREPHLAHELRRDADDPR